MVRISRSRMNMEDARIDRATLKDHAEIAIGSASTVFTGVGGTYTIDMTSGNTYSLVLNANCSFTFSNPTGSGNACSFTLILKQDGIGRRTVTWPGAVSWMSAVTPTLGTAAGDYDIFTFVTMDGGTKWFGSMGERDHQNGVGTLWVWGAGNSGLSGQNDTIGRSSPTQIGSLTSWTQISAGSVRTLATKSDGTLWSWGTAGGGETGQNDTIGRSSPTQVGALTNWALVAAGYRHSAAIKTDGTLWTWGQGGFGRLGHDSAIFRSSPTQVGALTNWAAIGVGYQHTVALKTDGTLWTWGGGNYGDLGSNGTPSVRSSPAQIGALTNWAAIAAVGHGRKTLALKTDGTLWTWGWGNGGQLGRNNSTSLSSPAQVGSDTNWAQIAAGADHSIAIKTDGTLWTWGQGANGQLGQNDILYRSSPTQVGVLTTWAQIAGGYKHTMALKTDGTIWTWGQGTNSQLGHNERLNRSSPTQVGTLTSWVAVSGENHTIARRFPA